MNVYYAYELIKGETLELREGKGKLSKTNIQEGSFVGSCDCGSLFDIKGELFVGKETKENSKVGTINYLSGEVEMDSYNGDLIVSYEYDAEVVADRMCKWFEYKQLPEHLQVISKPFGQLAEFVCENIKSGPERTVALRKLLEAKDAAVRSMVHPGG